MVGWHPSKSIFFFVKKLKSFFLFFFCSKLIRTSKWWDGTLRRTCSYPRHTTTLFVRGKLMKMTGPLLRSIYADTYASCMLTRMLLVPCSGQCMLTRMLHVCWHVCYWSPAQVNVCWHVCFKGSTKMLS
jgi:hypothetical protein